MENKCVIFLKGAQAHNTENELDVELMVNLKRILTEQGITVKDELLEEETTLGKQAKANAMIESIELENQRLTCVIYFMK